MHDPIHFEGEVTLLTAGRDRHYSLGLAMALAATGVKLDFVASDELWSQDLRRFPNLKFLNLRGDQSLNATLFKKAWRVIAYYLHLLSYAARSKSKIFHILWNNKFELFDRTALMAFYRLLGKRVILTAHNINAGVRDQSDSWINRVTLRIQYRLCERIFVHTNRMRDDLVYGFNVPNEKVVLIPYGWNNVVPNTALTGLEARQRLGLSANDKVILFFGNIAPYKGLELLLESLEMIKEEGFSVRLIIAGRPKGPVSYWEQIQHTLSRECLQRNIFRKIEYIADDEIEIYFKASDVLALPYAVIFQSGVLLLSYSFGLPVVATDVGSLKEDIIEGKTGFVCEPRNPRALATAIQYYFRSNLYHELESRRREIQQFAREKYSWAKVGAITAGTYSELLHEQKRSSALTPTGKTDESFSLNTHSSL